MKMTIRVKIVRACFESMFTGAPVHLPLVRARSKAPRIHIRHQASMLHWHQDGGWLWTAPQETLNLDEPANRRKRKFTAPRTDEESEEAAALTGP
jgi:hypothetical protein